jgi:TIR domain
MEWGVDPALRGVAFISYVREDRRRVDRLEEFLKAHGVPVWRDIHDVGPGEDWHAKIRDAIANDSLVFIACFPEIVRRDSDHINEMSCYSPSNSSACGPRSARISCLSASVIALSLIWKSVAAGRSTPSITLICSGGNGKQMPKGYSRQSGISFVPRRQPGDPAAETRNHRPARQILRRTGADGGIIPVPAGRDHP